MEFEGRFPVQSEESKLRANDDDDEEQAPPVFYLDPISVLLPHIRLPAAMTKLSLTCHQLTKLPSPRFWFSWT